MLDITGSTKHLAVIGSPISHTLSPQIHNTIIDDLSLDFIYTPFNVEKDKLKEAVGAFKTLNFVGFNVTIPHKSEIIKYLDEVDAYALSVNAVNTVRNRGGVLYGYNTDGLGFVKSLEREGVILQGKKVMILGAGGSAKGIAVALAWNGVKKIYINNRTKEKAAELVNIVNSKVPNVASFEEVSGDIDILINTTPVGMYPNVDDCPIEDFSFLNKGATVADIVYNPRETLLLRRAREAGFKTVPGIGMLIYQAVLAFEIFADTKVSDETVEKIFKRLLVDKSLVLTGFMGTGKSVVGNEIAKRVAAEYIDVDTLIEKNTQKTIPQIFEEAGEAGFREIEAKTIESLKDKKGAVIALGGGAVKNPKNINILRENGYVVRLNAHISKILKNIKKSPDTRPLLKGKTKEEIEKMIEEREPYYKNCDLEIDTTNLSVKDTATEILSKITLL